MLLRRHKTKPQQEETKPVVPKKAAKKAVKKDVK